MCTIPWADDDDEVKTEYGIDLISDLEMLKNGENNYIAVVLAVAHDKFKELDFRNFHKDNLVIYDI